MRRHLRSCTAGAISLSNILRAPVMLVALFEQENISKAIASTEALTESYGQQAKVRCNGMLVRFFNCRYVLGSFRASQLAARSTLFTLISILQSSWVLFKLSCAWLVATSKADDICVQDNLFIRPQYHTLISKAPPALYFVLNQR